MSGELNSPNVVRDETLRLATTHLAETAIARTSLRLNTEIREITVTIAVIPVIALVLGLAYSIYSEHMWIGILAMIAICAVPALIVLLMFKLNDRRELNNRLIAEYELRRRYGRV